MQCRHLHHVREAIAGRWVALCAPLLIVAALAGTAAAGDPSVLGSCGATSLWTATGGGGATTAPANDTYINPNANRSYAYFAQNTTLYATCNSGFAGNKKADGTTVCNAGDTSWSWQDTPPSTIQNFPSPVVLSADAGINTKEYIFLGTNRGFVFKLNAATGVVDAKSGDARRGTCTTDQVVATPAIQLGRYANAAFTTKFSATTDLVIVATHTMCSDSTHNRVIAYYADDLSKTPAWTFNKTYTKKVDFITDGPYIDYDNNRIYFGSNLGAGASQNTLWAVSTLDGSLAWSGNAGSIQNRPQMVYTDETTTPAQGRLYVAAADGSIQAYDINGDGAGNMLALWGTKALMPGTITRNLWYENRTGAFNGNFLVVDALGNLRAFHEDRDANTATLLWSQVANGSAAFTSMPAVYPSANVAFIGKSDGNLLQIDLSHGAYQGEASINPTASTVTDPTVDVQNGSDINVVTVAAASGAVVSLNASSFPSQACTSAGQACTCPAGNQSCDSAACAKDSCLVGRCTGAVCPGVQAPGMYPSCDCSNACVDMTTDANNCGMCGNTCTNLETCRKSVCSCVPGFYRCGSKCVSLSDDFANCGQCGKQCPNGKVCLGARCVAACAGPTTNCGGSCVNTLTDSRFCGGCNNACRGLQICINGTCGCGNGLTECPPGSGTCVDTRSDVNNCGGCNMKCGSAGADAMNNSKARTCVNSTCGAYNQGCATGTVCGVATGGNAANCGGGNWTGGTCAPGTARPVADGTACADGNGWSCDCANANADGTCPVTHCTGGNNDCPGSQACMCNGAPCGRGVSGVCDRPNDTCSRGKCSGATGCYTGAPCSAKGDHACTLPNSNPTTRDPAAPVCCGAVGCVDLKSDPYNCGACGVACATGYCADGFCRGSARCSFPTAQALSGVAGMLTGSDALAFDSASLQGRGGVCNAYTSVYLSQGTSGLTLIDPSPKVTNMPAPAAKMPLHGVAVSLLGDQAFGSMLSDGVLPPDLVVASAGRLLKASPDIGANLNTDGGANNPFSDGRFNRGPVGPVFDSVSYVPGMDGTRNVYLANWTTNGDLVRLGYTGQVWVAAPIVVVAAKTKGKRITAIAFGQRKRNGHRMIYLAVDTRVLALDLDNNNDMSEWADFKWWLPADGCGMCVPTAILGMAVHPVVGDLYLEVRDSFVPMGQKDCNSGPNVCVITVTADDPLTPPDAGAGGAWRADYAASVARRQSDICADEGVVVNPVPMMLGKAPDAEGRISISPDLNLLYMVPTIDGAPTFTSFALKRSCATRDQPCKTNGDCCSNSCGGQTCQ